MPFQAERSFCRLNERLGEDVANELVDWLNQVDATYRSDLKDLNELNFTRFDAKVEQRFAESDARLEHRFAEAEVQLERRFAESDAQLERRLAEMDARWEQRLSDIRADLIKWAFIFVAGGTLTVIGAMVALLRP